MADGYIGKISAVVTANTSDLEKKLNQGRDAVDKFANSLSASLERSSRSARDSLEKIFTPLQQFERKMQFALKLNIRTEAEVAKLRGLQSVIEGINKPAEALARQFAKLPMELQAGLIPVLTAAQDKVMLLNRKIQETGSVSARSFEIVEQAVKRASAVIGSAASAGSAPLIARAGAQQDFAALSRRLQEQAASDNAAPLIARARAEQEFATLTRRLQEQAAADEATVLTRRAQAQQDFYAISRRLQEQAASDSAAPLIARARAEQDFYETSRRLREQAAADTRRVNSEADFLPPNRGNEVYGPAGYTPLPPNYFQDSVATRMRGLMGPNFADEAQNGARRVDALAGRVAALKVELDKLPMPVAAEFVPALRDAENAMVRLRLPGATTAEIEAATAAMRALESAAARHSRADVFRDRFGTAEGFSAGLDEAALRGFEAQMRIAQAAVGAMAAEMNGPARAAAVRLGAAMAGFAADGAAGTRAARQEIARLQQEFAAAVTAGGGAGGAGLIRRMNRAGDIGRMGADRWGLGLQQLGFAVDDFMSSTGGVDQKLRAISNNLSQFAFIVGGTTGLFVALGITLTGQVALGLMKFVNGGKSADDMSKTLNDSLSKQKTLAEELAAAYRKLGDSISDKAFSSAAKEGAQFRRELAEVVQKQREARQEQALFSNPRAIEVGGQINRLNRELKDVTSVGQAVAIRSQIRALEAELRQIRSGSLNSAVPTRNEVANAIGYRENASATTVLGGGALDVLSIMLSLGANQFFRSSLETRLGRAAIDSASRIDPNDRAGMMAAIESRMAEIRPSAGADMGFMTFMRGESTNILAMREEMAKLEALRGRFGDAKSENEIIKAFEVGNEIGTALEGAVREASQAMSDGASGAAEFAIALHSIATQLQKEQEAMRAAEAMPSGTAEEQSRRRAALTASRIRIEGLAAQVPKVQEQQTAVQTSRIINQEATVQFRVDRIKSNLSGMNLDTGSLGVQVRSIDMRRQQLDQLRAAAETSGNVQRQQSVAQAYDALFKTTQGFDAATNATRMFTDSLMKAGNQAMQDAQSRRDSAVAANIALNTPQTRLDRANAEQDARNMEAAIAKRDAAIAKFISDNQANPDVQALADVNSRIANGTTIATQEFERLQQQRAALERSVTAGPRSARAVVEAQSRFDAASEAVAARRQLDGLAKSVLGVPFDGVSFDANIRAIEAAKGVGSQEAETARELYRKVQEAFRQFNSGAIDWKVADAQIASYGKAIAEAEASIKENQKKLDEVNARIAAGNMTPDQAAAARQEQQRITQKLAADNAQLQRELEAPAVTGSLAASRVRGEAIVRQLTGIQAGTDLQQRLMDIRNAPDLAGFTRQENENLRNRAVEQAWREAATGVAPAIMALYDSVQNAILSGPSRAALNVSDVSTVEGAKELNRLLRGEDPNKDQNLVELRSQSQSLRELVRQGAQRVQVGVANN